MDPGEGSRYNDANLLRTLRARFCIISGGDKNHGLPTFETLQYIVKSRRRSCFESVDDNDAFYVVFSHPALYSDVKGASRTDVFQQELNPDITTIEQLRGTVWASSSATAGTTPPPRKCPNDCFAPICRRYGVIYFSGEVNYAKLSLVVKGDSKSASAQATLTQLKGWDCNTMNTNSACSEITL
jgi:hypothetical protein